MKEDIFDTELKEALLEEERKRMLDKINYGSPEYKISSMNDSIVRSRIKKRRAIEKKNRKKNKKNRNRR